MEIKLTESDVAELQDVFPTLSSSIPRQQIWGTLDFACSYDEGTRKLDVDESSENYLSDDYEIRVDFRSFSTFGFPEVFDESGKIIRSAETLKLALKELHVEDDGSCCLGVFPEYKWKGACSFIIDKVIPYFYWQSHCYKFRSEPWAGLSHGYKGVREEMCNVASAESASNHRNLPCSCGSGMKYKKCCSIKEYELTKYLKNK